jgi:hypothetical protein
MKHRDSLPHPPVTETTPWPPRPDELANWPTEWRKKWGLRSNELEDEGLAWNDAERRAFIEVKAEYDMQRVGIDHDTGA